MGYLRLRLRVASRQVPDTCNRHSSPWANVKADQQYFVMGDTLAAGFKNVVSSVEEYDAAITRANEGRLVVIAVWSEANPICIATEPKIQKMSAEYTDADFYKMHLNSQTQPMIKFGVQNTPIFILAQGEWATTILGANMRMLEDALRQRTS